MTPEELAAFEDFCLLQEMRILQQLNPELYEDETDTAPEFDPEQYDVEIRK